MIQYSNARKALFAGTFLSFVISAVISVSAVYALYRFDSYLDCYYTQVFFAEAAVLFPTALGRAVMVAESPLRHHFFNILACHSYSASLTTTTPLLEFFIFSTPFVNEDI